VGNDPVNNLDPTGTRCVIANSGSPYCRRAELYREFDRRVSSHTRFFAAAAATVSYLANNDLPLSGNVISDAAESFLNRVSADLSRINRRAFYMIQEGLMSGPDLDRRLVRMEQNRVQEHLDRLEPDTRRAIISSINGSFRSGLLRFVAGLGSPSDARYGRALNNVERRLGRDIDFGNQGDREAIGHELIRQARTESIRPLEIRHHCSLREC
jgi:hypothetical protein